MGSEMCIRDSFDSWWDYQPPREAEPVTASDRLDALEAAVYDLAEVVYNG